MAMSLVLARGERRGGRRRRLRDLWWGPEVVEAREARGGMRWVVRREVGIGVEVGKGGVGERRDVRVSARGVKFWGRAWKSG